MPTGRCAGCGETGKNSSIIEHTRYCPEFIALYRRNPEAALAPEAEFTRWNTEQRADDRAARREAAIDEAGRRRAEQAARWETPADILEG